MTEDTRPAIGSIWTEDYPYYAPGYARRIEVVGYADDGRVIISNINPANGRRTKAKTDRFGKKGGYLPVTQ